MLSVPDGNMGGAKGTPTPAGIWASGILKAMLRKVRWFYYAMEKNAHAIKCSATLAKVLHQ
jgi:hypothetical protein